ncbi:MAG: glycosyltransferase [Bacteroidales bacterium]
MRVLLINRNDFVDGGADRVFLNTYDLLQAANCSSPSLFQGGVGVGTSVGVGVGTSGSLGEGTSTAVEGTLGAEFSVNKFTRQDVGLDHLVDPRSLSWWAKLRMVKDYLYNKRVGKCLDRKIREFNPDVAHVHLIFGTLSVSVLRVLKKHGVPIIMTVHDYRLICPANAMLDRHGKVCERCRGSRYYNCLIRRCSEGNLFFSGVIMLEAYMRKYLVKPLKLVDHFIFVSQFARNKHLEFEPRYALKSSHLYNMNLPVPETPIIKGDYFLYFGRISREKGILTLIKASQIAGVKLIIAGTGPQEEEIRRQEDYKTIRLEDSKTLRPGEGEKGMAFVGFKSGEELNKLIRESSFVVVPSEWYENNPMTVVEAFSLGKPVIGARIGGIPELVTPENGYLFESGSPESLAEALTKAEKMKFEEYSKMSESCKEFASKNFDRTRHFEHLTGIYQQVLN